MAKRRRKKVRKRIVLKSKKRLAGGLALVGAGAAGYKGGKMMATHGVNMLTGSVPGGSGAKAAGLIIGGYALTTAVSGTVAGEGLARSITSFKRVPDRRKRRGRGGARKGHAFFGNQYTKVTKYARKTKNRVGSHLRKNRKKYSMAGAIGAGLGTAIATRGRTPGVRIAGLLGG